MSETKHIARRTDGIKACVITCLVINGVAWKLPWFFSGALASATAGLVASQLSLVALWGATSRKNLYLRFLIVPLATVAAWIFLVVCFQLSISQSKTGIWLMAMAANALVVVLATNLYQRFSRREEQYALSFDIKTLMLWTGVFASMFGTWQLGRAKADWYLDSSMLNWTATLFSIQIVTALTSCFWCWVFFQESWKWGGDKILLAACVATLFGFLLYGPFSSLASSQGFAVDQIFLPILASNVCALVAFSIIRGLELFAK